MERLTQDQVDRYLRRIDAGRPPQPDRAGLAQLQLAHLLGVPFENLDIHVGRPIVLGLEAAYDKIVERHRGGYCYELNTSFAALLAGLGYEVTLLSARVARDEGRYGPEFAHLALAVKTVDSPHRLLVDVGFGDGFSAPLRLVDGHAQADRSKAVRVHEDTDGWVYEDGLGASWKPRYRFGLQARRLHEFESMNVWQQTAPDSIFVQQPMVTRLTIDGRVTLSGRRLIRTEGTRRTEIELAGQEVPLLLDTEFGVVLDVPIPW